MQSYNQRKTMKKYKTITLADENQGKKMIRSRHKAPNVVELDKLQLKTLRERPPDEFLFNAFKNSKDHFLDYKDRVIATVINN